MGHPRTDNHHTFSKSHCATCTFRCHVPRSVSLSRRAIPQSFSGGRVSKAWPWGEFVTFNFERNWHEWELSFRIVAPFEFTYDSWRSGYLKAQVALSEIRRLETILSEIRTILIHSRVGNLWNSPSLRNVGNRQNMRVEYSYERMCKFCGSL